MMHGQKNIKLGFQDVKAPIFLDNRHMKVVGCQPYAPAAFTPRDILVLTFRGWVSPRCQMPQEKSRRYRESIPRPSGL